MVFCKKKFGKRLLSLRKTKNVSAKLLADHLGIGKSAISLMQSGQRGASIEIMYALADYFNVSVDYLIGRSDDPQRH